MLSSDLPVPWWVGSESRSPYQEHPNQDCAKRNSSTTTDASDGGLAQTCCGLDLLERRLMESLTTVIVPFDERIILVRLLNCAEFSSRLSEVAQPLDPISGIQFLVGGRGLGEWWSLCTV
jgi:hypothetical protein